MANQSLDEAYEGKSIDRSSLRNELLALFESWNFELPTDLDDDTPLIASGLFDSLALLNLSVWIESKIGRMRDPTSVDVAKEWDSIASILGYVENAATKGEKAPTPQTRSAPPSSMGENYRIVTYNPSFKSAIADLQTGLWSSSPEFNHRYMEWKYDHNPYTEQIHIYLVLHNDEPVAMRGFYESLWEGGLPTRRFRVLVADDLLVREDHRNRGLVTRIMNAAHEDLRESQSRFFFNLSGGPLTVLGSLGMGWKSIGMLKPFIYISYESTGNEPHPFFRLDHAETPIRTNWGQPIEVSTRPRPKQMAALVDRVPYDGRFRHVRDEAYFDWRFGNPMQEYRFLFAGGDKLDGYLILKRWVRPGHSSDSIEIADIEAINPETTAALLQTALDAGDFSKIVIWAATASSDLLKRLQALGFQKHDDSYDEVPGLPCFLVRPIADEFLDQDWRLGDTRLLDLESWDIRMLYSMTG